MTDPVAAQAADDEADQPAKPGEHPILAYLDGARVVANAEADAVLRQGRSGYATAERWRDVARAVDLAVLRALEALGDEAGEG